MTYFSWSFEPLAMLLAANLFSRPTCIMTITGTSSLNCRVFFLQGKELIKKKRSSHWKSAPLQTLLYSGQWDKNPIAFENTVAGWNAGFTYDCVV